MPRSKKGPEEATAAKKPATKKTSAVRVTKAAAPPAATPVAVEAQPAKQEAVIPEVVEQKIRHRAYELFLLRNGHEGDPTEDWLRAEAEVKAKLVA